MGDTRAPQERRVAFLAIHGLTEAEIAKSARALEGAGIPVDVIGVPASLVAEAGQVSRPSLSVDRVSAGDYAALAIPATPDHACAINANAALAGFVQAMQAAGKPILFTPPPAGAAGAELECGPPPFSLVKLCSQSWQNWNAIDAPRLGAALAYYTLLSLAPLVVVIVSIAGVFFRRPMIQSGLIWQVRSLMGDVAAALIEPVVENTRSATGIIAGVLGMLTLLLGASGVFLELRNSLDTVWGVRPPYGTGLRSLVKERLFAFLMVLGTGLILSVSILLSAILATPIRFLLRFVPDSGVMAGALSTAVSAVVMTVVFALIYKIVPDIRIRWGDVWIGALVTSILFTAGKALIGLYLEHAGVGSPYAAAGSLIVFLSWVYYSVQIFLLGAEFTHEYALRHGSYSLAEHRVSRFWQRRPPAP